MDGKRIEESVGRTLPRWFWDDCEWMDGWMDVRGGGWNVAGIWIGTVFNGGFGAMSVTRLDRWVKIHDVAWMWIIYENDTYSNRTKYLKIEVAN